MAIMRKMKIIVVEDHPLIRGSLRILVKRLVPDCEFREADRLAAVHLLIEEGFSPDLILLDLGLPDGKGRKSLETIRKWLPASNIVVISASSESDYGALAHEYGVAEYIEKSVGLAKLSETLQNYLISGKLPRECDIKISKRQRELLQLMNEGLSNREIGNRLSISEHTVKVHAWRLFRRLNVRSRSQATLMGRTMGWLDD